MYRIGIIHKTNASLLSLTILMKGRKSAEYVHRETFKDLVQPQVGMERGWINEISCSFSSRKFILLNTALTALIVCKHGQSLENYKLSPVSTTRVDG